MSFQAVGPEAPKADLGEPEPEIYNSYSVHGITVTTTVTPTPSIYCDPQHHPAYKCKSFISLSTISFHVFLNQRSE